MHNYKIYKDYYLYIIYNLYYLGEYENVFTMDKNNNLGKSISLANRAIHDGCLKLT